MNTLKEMEGEALTVSFPEAIDDATINAYSSI
jgi:hypothetical protein